MKYLFPWLLSTAVVGVAAAGIFYGVAASTRLPDGPSELVWDREACAFCAMHVGEPAFAAQLQTKDGRTLAFDDPGCLFAQLDRDPVEVHAIYFHHCREDRWIRSDATAFVEVSPTPMGYGLGAVDRDAPGGITVGRARELVLQRRAREPGR